MFKKIIAVLVIFIAVFAVVVAMQPDDFRVTRSVTILASVETIFPHVNNQRQWQDWSPWAKLDPNAKYTFEGPDAGIGSIVKWSGNNQMGEGMSTIVESRPNAFIQFKLDFIRPMEGHNMSEFTFRPEINQTNVTWTMYGTQNFMAKAVGLVMNCEKMVGDQFDTGLASLKAMVEKR